MEKAHLIYFFQVLTTQVKIGIVRDFKCLRQRIVNLQIGNHQELYLVKLLYGAREHEKWLHNRYKNLNKHIQGEWFEFDEDMLTIIPTNCLEADINIETSAFFESKTKRTWIKLEPKPKSELKTKPKPESENVRRYFPKLQRYIELNLR